MWHDRILRRKFSPYANMRNFIKFLMDHVFTGRLSTRDNFSFFYYIIIIFIATMSVQ